MTRILDVAAHLFGDKGYAQTSIRDVADAVGLLPGSLYYYLDRKEDLLHAVLFRQHQALLQRADEIRGEEQPVLQRLRTFIDWHIDFALGPLGRSVAYRDEFQLLTGAQQKVIRGMRRDYERRLAALVSTAQSDAVVCPDLDPEASARAILELLNSLQRWQLQDSAHAVGSPLIRTTYSDMALAGLLCDPVTHVSGHRSRVGRGDGRTRPMNTSLPAKESNEQKVKI